ncbi:hypothetical protein [Candidatus Protochlamydia amoebophila]|uniref:Uncharacterized protein n=1 Tax=Protochlamydia amoebophila (strain UWE25) TaxID=264201 RepID=Q6MCH3_PARUW|nr:hypothetical protein [Candidatus Protochlamydia amoebophila]CAF23726.1 unnamed protein product [Candidatus Protochlamydia amoebophila UWE25]
MMYLQPCSPKQGYQSDQDMPYKAAKPKEVVQTNLPIKAKVKDVCKDAFAEWLHTQDPDLPIEVLNKLPTEEIATWRILAPLNSHSFFHKWLDSKITSFYADQSKMEQELKAIYQKFKTQNLAKLDTVAGIDQLARDILKEYSKTIEDQAADDTFLTSYFARTLQIPSESKLMRLTIEHAKKSIREIVSERLGYLYNDEPRECLKKVLAYDYPNQIDQVSYLVNIWGKSGRTFAPIWEQ